MKTTMKATVIHVRHTGLTVFDHKTRQEVIVHADNTCRFHPGDRICIEYNGIMTLSLPPQISADCIVRL